MHRDANPGGAFPEEQAVHIAIVPLLHLSSRASI
jgi:hypothetical protein